MTQAHIEISLEFLLFDGWRKRGAAFTIPDGIYSEAREMAIGRAENAIHRALMAEFYPNDKCECFRCEAAALPAHAKT